MPSERLLGKWIARIYRATHIFMAEKLKGTGVAYGQFPFLIFVSKNPGICQEAIVRELFYDKGTTARAMKKLEECNLIERRVSSCDRRKYLVYVTPMGEQMVNQLKTLLIEWNTSLVSGMSTEDGNLACELLAHIAGNATSKARKDTVGGLTQNCSLRNGKEKQCRG